jgi:hypothetical protein
MATKRQCPKCSVTLTKYEWSRLWWMSSVLSGRLVQPCSECGTKLRLSSMTLVTSAGALGLIGTSVSLFFYRSPVLLIVALVCAVVILFGVLGTRLEVAPQIPPDALKQAE